MRKEPIIHHALPHMHWLTKSGTSCMHIVPNSQVTMVPIEATCKICLKVAVTKQDKRKMCVGCEDNFYNGNNTLGIQECWNLDKAQITLRKKVHISEVPPYIQAPIKVLNCRREKGYAFTNPEIQDPRFK